jgi:hypothetical protein
MLSSILNVSHEEAITIALDLQDSAVHETPSIKIVSGRHPAYGPIHVLLPAMGGWALLPALLPVVSHIASL